MKRIVALTVLLCLLPLGAAAAGPELESKSAYLLDVATGTVLYEKNAREALPPASVTKVMTMLLIMEAVDSGVLGWDDPVTASANAAAKGGSQIYLREGEIMTVADMLKSIAVSSANDCACAMAEHLAGSEAAFVERMNRRAEELGMEDTHFVNCTGLDDGPQGAEHRTSARDIALMSRQLLLEHPDILKFTTIWMDTVRNGEFGLSNTNKLVRFYPGATGLKTGYTSAAKYCLSASAQREGLHLVAVVMGAETSAARFADSKALLDYGFAGYAMYTPELTSLPPVAVKLGQTEQVKAVLSAPAPLLVEKSRLAGITAKAELPGEVSAPVQPGQQLGRLLILSGEEVLAELPLVAEAPVERLTWGDIFLKLLKHTVMAPG